MFDAHFHDIVAVRVEDSDHIIRIGTNHTGKSLSSDWVPFPITFSHGERHGIKYRVPGDVAGTVGFTCSAFNRRAVEAIGHVLTAHGELLPVECAEGDYALFNLTVVRDALDLARSDLRDNLMPSGIIFDDYRNRYVLDPDKIGDVMMFRLTRVGGPMVTEEFVRLVEAHGLTGFRFPLLWDSEQP